jgi:CheY-like chemotaxis protein
MTHALIIDDDANNGEVLAELLQMEGISSSRVQNPTTLDRTLTGDQYDVVFLDLEMPNLNGYQVLEKIQANANYSGIPVVAYTVHLNEIHTAKEVGFHSFIGKPLNVERFSDQLQRILKGIPVWEVL